MAIKSRAFRELRCARTQYTNVRVIAIHTVNEDYINATGSTSFHTLHQLSFLHNILALVLVLCQLVSPRLP